MDIFYIECLILWTAISGYIGSLNIATAVVAAGFWIVIVWIGGWLPPEDMASWLMVLVPCIAPLIGHMIGRVARRHSRSQKEKSDLLLAELESARNAARETAAEKTKMPLVPTGGTDTVIWANHVLLNVTDLPKTLAFYRDIFAMTEVSDHDLGDTVALLNAGRLFLILSQVGSPGSERLPDFSFDRPQLGLGVVDLATIRARLAKCGYSAETDDIAKRIGRPNHPNADHQLHVLDPDGHTILISESLSLSARRHRAALRRNESLEKT